MFLKLFLAVAAGFVAVISILKDRKRGEPLSRADRWLLFLAVFTALGSAIVVINDEIESTKKSLELKEAREAATNLTEKLVETNTKLSTYLREIEEKDTRIKDLELAAKRAAAGVTEVYTFNGILKKSNSPGSVLGTIGEPFHSFQRMQGLYRAQDWLELEKLSSEQVTKYPAWHSPLWFRGIAEANLAKFDLAESDFKEFIARADGLPGEWADAVLDAKMFLVKMQSDPKRK